MRFLAGFLIGLVLGAAAVLLTTPKSGSDLKGDAQSRLKGILAEGRRAADERKAELQARITELRAG